MKYLSAYLLSQLSGNESPSAKDVTKILSSVGAEVDSARVELLIKEFKGKDIQSLIVEGSKKLASVPTGGAAAPAAASAAAPAAARGRSASPAKKEAKKEEKEESDDDMGFGLFD